MANAGNWCEHVTWKLGKMSFIFCAVDVIIHKINCEYTESFKISFISLRVDPIEIITGLASSVFVCLRLGPWSWYGVDTWPTRADILILGAGASLGCTVGTERFTLAKIWLVLPTINWLVLKLKQVLNLGWYSKIPNFSLPEVSCLIQSYYVKKHLGMVKMIEFWNIEYCTKVPVWVPFNYIKL